MVGTTKFIDLKSQSLSSEAIEIAGIYDLIEGNIGKAICLANVNYGGTDKGTAYVDFVVSGDDFIVDVFGKRITINDDDEITVGSIPETKEIPTYPTEAGTYKLQLVIAEGSDPALTWEEVE